MTILLIMFYTLQFESKDALRPNSERRFRRRLHQRNATRRRPSSKRLLLADVTDHRHH